MSWMKRQGVSDMCDIMQRTQKLELAYQIMNELLSVIDSFDPNARHIANPENGGGGDGGKVKYRSQYLDLVS